jgi:hypothetical protein
MTGSLFSLVHLILMVFFCFGLLFGMSSFAWWCFPGTDSYFLLCRHRQNVESPPFLNEKMPFQDYQCQFYMFLYQPKVTRCANCYQRPDIAQRIYNVNNEWMGSMSGSVIQATGRSEFEGGLRSGGSGSDFVCAWSWIVCTGAGLHIVYWPKSRLNSTRCWSHLEKGSFHQKLWVWPKLDKSTLIVVGSSPILCSKALIMWSLVLVNKLVTTS